ncbi:purine nucleoside permease, partial [Dichomitus squalens]
RYRRAQDPRRIPYRYVPEGATAPAPAPVAAVHLRHGGFKMNDVLRQRAVALASNVDDLNDTASAHQYRGSCYAGEPQYAAAPGTSRILACDTATSEVWWSSALLGAVFENTATLIADGTGLYCRRMAVLGLPKE